MKCKWKEDEDNWWHTSCDHLFEFIDGGPKENKFKYCCYCGGELIPIEMEDEL